MEVLALSGQDIGCEILTSQAQMLNLIGFTSWLCNSSHDRVQHFSFGNANSELN